MANFYAAVEAVLNPLAPGGASYGRNKTQPLAEDGAGTVQPYITWQLIVVVDNETLANSAGEQPHHIQVDIFAPTILAADEIRGQVDAALIAAFKTVRLSKRDEEDELVGLWHITREFNLWFDESAA